MKNVSDVVAFTLREMKNYARLGIPASTRILKEGQF
jgi:hypothetical protein